MHLVMACHLRVRAALPTARSSCELCLAMVPPLWGHPHALLAHIPWGTANDRLPRGNQ